ncbi:MAG: 30S ribosomal protein S6 [Candidatus Omnitrophica bacterium ADurb.Bin277]|nr:MAG: 30S ribosomal protein S6 [Candidatus Omnitrophica bacterium ADurb.Bin277]
MRKYEGLFIFPPEAAGEGPKDPAGEVTKRIEKFQGKIVQKIDLGKKPIGHAIGKYREGKMLVVHFEMDPSRMQDFRKELELQDSLLKYMVTVFEESARVPAAVVPASAPETAPEE